jgi:gluconate 5-dehydrogenase
MTEPGLFSLHGKRALITGAELLLNDCDGGKLAATAAELRRLGRGVTAAALDVARPVEVAAGVAQLEREGGPADILINNAGIHRRAPLAGMPDENWHRVLDVNLTSAFLVTRAVAPGMIARRGGKIINVCSMNCEIARPNIANYAAAKGGLKMLTRAMAGEWAKHNIQANGLGPGYLLTEMTRAVAADLVFDGWIRRRTPAGRWGDPQDLVGAAVLLAARASDYMNGQVLLSGWRIARVALIARGNDGYL